MSSHVVNFSLLLKPINNLRNLFANNSHSFTIIVKLINDFLVVAQFSFLSIKKFILRVFMTLLSQIFNFLSKDLSVLLEVHDLGFIKEVQFLLNIFDLVCDRWILFIRSFPVTNEVLSKIKSLFKIVKPNEHTNIFLLLIIHNIDSNFWSLVKLVLYFLFLALLVLKLLNHSAELHHVNGSASDLSGDKVTIISFFFEVLPDDTEELTHIRIALNHLFETLHLIKPHEFFFEKNKLVKLLIGNLVLILSFLKILLRSTLWFSL